MVARINLFVGWYLVLQIFLNNVLAEFGTALLGILGMPSELAERMGWLVGVLFLVALLLIVRVYFKELPPGVGKPQGKGYKLGHALIFASSIFALGVYLLPFFIHDIKNDVLQVFLARIVVGLLYPALGLFGIGVSFIYQSALPALTPPQQQQ
jgi:hypothetical protein